MDHSQVRQEQLSLYEGGDYAALSATLRPAARDLVVTTGVATGHRVLDVGAGDGNVALEALDRGGLPVACDLSAVQLVRARRRDDRVICVTADSERLPLADSAFDAVLSAFGAVFAPDPSAATAEMFRVVAPRGVVALTSWPDDGFMAQIAAAVRAASLSPGSFPDQDLGWGDPERARARFEAHCSSVEVHRRTLVIDPAVRGAAGEGDCAARYVADHVRGTDLGAMSAEIAGRFALPGGKVRADYLLVLGRAP